MREALVIIDDIRDVVEAGAKGLQYRLLLTKLFPLPTRVTMFAHREIARHRHGCASGPASSSARNTARCS